MTEHNEEDKDNETKSNNTNENADTKVELSIKIETPSGDVIQNEFSSTNTPSDKELIHQTIEKESNLDIDATRLKGIGSDDVKDTIPASPSIDDAHFEALLPKILNEDIESYGTDVLQEVVESRLKGLIIDNTKMRHYLRVAYQVEVDENSADVPILAEGRKDEELDAIKVALHENANVHEQIANSFEVIHEQDEMNYRKQHDLIALESDYQELKDMKNDEALACHNYRKELKQLKTECQRWESLGKQIVESYNILNGSCDLTEGTPLRQTPLKRRTNSMVVSDN